MKDKPSIKLNFFYNLAFQILTIIVPIITTPYLSRTLRPAGNGIYSYTHAIAFFFSLFAALGTNSYGQREIAYKQDNRKERSVLFWELFFARLGTVSIALIIYIIFALVSDEYRLFFVLQATIIFAVAFDISWLFTGVEDYKLTTVRNAIIKIVTVVLIFIFIKNENDIWKYILIMGVSQIVSGLYMFAYLPRYVDRIKLNQISITKHLKGTIEFFLPVLAVQLYSQIDKVMLGKFCDIKENGYYEQARKITNLAVSVVVSINTVLYSRISYLFNKNEKEVISGLYRKSLSIMFLLLFPLVVGLFVISDSFTLWFFGEEYSAVGSLLRLSCPLIIFMCIGNFVGVQFLNPTRQQNKATIIYMISATLNILLNILLIPKFQSTGALIASNFSEFASCVLQVVLLLKSSYKFRPSKDIINYLFCAVLMGIVVFFLNRYLPVMGAVLTIIEVAIGALVYFGFLLLIKDKNTSETIKSITDKLHLTSIGR